MNKAEPDRKVFAARLSIATNVTFAVLKLVVGSLVGSVGIMSDGVHSLSDVLASVMAMYAIGIAQVPPDEHHPYGHGKVESLSALTQALILLVVVVFIIERAITGILAHVAPENPGWGMLLIGGAAVVNFFVMRTITQIAKTGHSPALAAVAQDHRADVITASGVFVGLTLVHLTGHGYFDQLAAICVALVILRSAGSVILEAAHSLLDGQLSAEELEIVRDAFNADPNVLGYHKVKTRKSGAVRFVDAHVFMADTLTFMKSHAAAENLEERIRSLLPGSVVTLHAEPYHAEMKQEKAGEARPFDEVIK